MTTWTPVTSGTQTAHRGGRRIGTVGIVSRQVSGVSVPGYAALRFVAVRETGQIERFTSRRRARSWVEAGI